MSRGPEADDGGKEKESSQPNFWDSDSSGNSFPKLSNEEIARSNAIIMTREVDDARKGNASVTEHLLAEAHEMQKNHSLGDVAKNLEKSGDAKVVYGKDGEVEHIIFNGKNGEKPVDLDLKNDSVNGKSEKQLKADSIQQAKDYFAAGVSDPQMTDKNGKPLSAEAQKQATQLMNAVLDGNLDAMTKAAQDIMKNPAMKDSIDYVMRRISMPSPMSFEKDAAGQPYLKVNGGIFDAVVIPASGKAQAMALDAYGIPKPGTSANMDKTLQSASQTALTFVSDSLHSAEGYLNMVGRMPKDGYTNMKALEHAYREKHPVEDGIKLESKLIEDLAKLTPEQREEVLRKMRQQH